MRERLFHPWLLLRVQIALGLLFVAAAAPKLMDPPAFAKAVWHYGLLPPGVVPIVALALPWLELLAGACLVLGVWVRAAALWIALLLVGFMGALGINLGRGRPVDCGCFQVGTPPRSEAERLRDMRWALLRDAGMLLMAMHAVAAGRGRKAEAPRVRTDHPEKDHQDPNRG